MGAKVKNDMAFTKVFILELIATIAPSIIIVPMLSDPWYADWINSDPAIGWALVLTYWGLTLYYYALPLFQTGGQEVLRIKRRQLRQSRSEPGPALQRNCSEPPNLLRSRTEPVNWKLHQVSE